MSRPQPTRPGVSRKPSGPSTQTNTPQRSGGLSQEEIDAINALPEFEDGTQVDLDPANSNDGGLGSGEGTTVVVTAANFKKFDYNGKTEYPAEVRLFLKLSKDGQELKREESLKYGEFAKFVASKDGNFVTLRLSAIKKNKDGSDYVPRPYKFSPAVMFLQSLKDAGFSVEKLNKEGVKSIVGLTLHIRRRKVVGQGDTAKPVLLVDYIGTGGAVNAPVAPSAPAAPATPPAAPKAQAPATQSAPAATQSTQAASEVDSLAEQALLDILGAAEGNTISRAQIPTTLIRIEQWKSHEQRGAILKTLRDDNFINREGSPWKVSGNSVSL